MQCCKTVTLRFRDRRNGTQSLFLEFYPGYRDPETMELRRRHSLGLYIYKNPTNQIQKEYNEAILSRAERIRCKVFLEVMDEKYDFFRTDKMKESFLDYFKFQIDRNKDKREASYKHFEIFTKGKCTFEELDLPFCRKFMEYLLNADSTIHDKKISQNTASAYWNVFKNVLEVAYKDRRITDNLADMLDNIPCKETTKNSLSLDEVRMLSASECEIPVIRRAAIFSCLSGLRISDILNLKWENIRNYADGTKYLDFICVKTKRQTIVPISTEAYELLEPENQTSNSVFDGFKREMSYNEMQDWLKECGIKKHITFHCFRHTYASLLLELGSDIYTVQRLLNHKSVATTQIYTAHADPKTREASTKITLTDVKQGKEDKGKAETDSENTLNRDEKKEKKRKKK